MATLELTVNELSQVLGISEEEAILLNEKEIILEREEAEKLAAYKGVTFETICDYFEIII